MADILAGCALIFAMSLVYFTLMVLWARLGGPRRGPARRRTKLIKVDVKRR